MKKLISFIVIVALLTGTAYALACEKATFPIYVNGEKLEMSDPPLAFNGRSYLPIKPIGDALDVSVEWRNNRVEIDTIDLEKLKDSCVMVTGGDEEGEYVEQSSGVIIDYDEVLTAGHASDHEYFAIHYDNSESYIHCSLINISEAKDSAILEPENKDVKPVKIGDSDDVLVGDKVFAISSPHGEKNVISSGMITDVNFYYKGMRGYMLSFSTLEGGSGGGVFNQSGELIGMMDAANSKSTFVIPINDIRESLAA